ncbi:MAG: rhomboid family intramembrane serine protease [Dehalococcoidales bacterium]|nr:rhomboid family intramembrane serine protease [Dehalococcoidales bacterium]
MQYRVSYRGSDGFRLGPIGFLILINLILLIVTLIVPRLKFDLGLAPFMVTSRPWTIITNMFIHDGIWHFFTNMLTLFFFGNYLMRYTGKTGFFVTYFLAGLMGNLFYLGYAQISEATMYSVAIGASGAVFGVAGALTVLKPKMTVFIIPIPVPIPLWIAILGGFLLLSVPGFAGNIAWQAHLGGLVLGLIVGLYYRKKPRIYLG